MNLSVLNYSRIYITALSLIALFIISSQIFVQFHLRGQDSSSRIINISGRQRMLSQKLSKEAFMLIKTQNSKTFTSLGFLYWVLPTGNLEPLISSNC